MNIDPKAELAGLPIVDVRDALAFVGHSRCWRADAIAERLWLKEDQTVEEILECLSTLGYVEACTEESDTWQCTPLGNQFSKARATKPIRRTTARKHLHEFMDRVAQVNASELYAYRVSRILLFGSYFTSHREFVSDLDLAVELEQRWQDKETQAEHYQSRITAAFAEGREFHTIVEQYAWPQEEVLRFLRSRSRVIRLHYVFEILDNNWSHCELLDAQGTSLLHALEAA